MYSVSLKSQNFHIELLTCRHHADMPMHCQINIYYIRYFIGIWATVIHLNSITPLVFKLLLLSLVSVFTVGRFTKLGMCGQ